MEGLLTGAVVEEGLYLWQFSGSEASPLPKSCQANQIQLVINQERDMKTDVS